MIARATTCAAPTRDARPARPAPRPFAPRRPALGSSRPALPAARPNLGAPRTRGLSLVETLVALAITALLLTATVVALDASFHSYAVAAEQASAQASTRMVTHRLLTLIRTSTAHGPLLPSANPLVTLSGNTLTSPYIELLDPRGQVVRVEYRADAQELWMLMTPAAGGTTVQQPIMGGVTGARFVATRRQNALGVWVLDRATMDLTVQPGVDDTLPLESDTPQPIRVIASTAPRKID